MSEAILSGNLVSAICSAEGLTDVAAFGRAIQSGRSQWSRPDDPMRALREHGDEFAFHTDAELAPWWLLDLRSVYRPEYIVIRNRNNGLFLEDSRDMIVDIADDDGKFVNIYRGLTYFGCDPYSIPLVLWLRGSHKIRFVRLSLEGKGCLCLSRVHVLAGERLPSADGPLFVAMRDDGFGERIKALLNAMVLAAHFDTDFRFSWPNLDVISSENRHFHAISSMEETFSPDFVARHAFRSEYEPWPVPVETLDFENSQIPQVMKRDSISVHQNTIDCFPETFKRGIDSQAFGKAFADIGFSLQMEAARAAALNLDTGSDAVAIHVRSGDLILGTWRFVDRFGHKLIPVFIIVALMKKIHNEGKNIILFGQESFLLQALQRIVPSAVSEEFYRGRQFNGEQVALFDMTLMSRCSAIYAGASGFALAAKWIGGGALISPDQIFGSRETIDILIDGIRNASKYKGIDPLHVSYALWYIYKYGGDYIAHEERLSYLEQALDIDSESPLLLLARASEAYVIGDDHLGDRCLTLAERVSEDASFGLKHILSPQWDGYVTGAPFLPSLRTAASRGSAVASACIAVADHSAGNVDGAREAARIALRSQSAPFGLLLREMLESV